MNQSDGGEGVPDLMGSVLRAARAVEDRIEQGLAAEGLSMAKLGVLNVLVEAPQPLSLGEVATRLACVRSNVTQLVDRLEAQGLVQRRPDPGDRRSVAAVITEDGRTRQEVGARVLESLQAQVAESLSGFNLDHLEEALRALK